ncbi:MAG: hypothetical protein AAFZ49_17510, partial [Cyanobacteria bacterium J06659_2]
ERIHLGTIKYIDIPNRRGPGSDAGAFYQMQDFNILPTDIAAIPWDVCSVLFALSFVAIFAWPLWNYWQAGQLR